MKLPRAFLWFMAVAALAPAARAAASSAPCFQAALDLLTRHDQGLPRLEPAAEATAQRLLAGGRLYLAGDTGWVDEGNGRAGGLRCALLLTNAAQLRPGDIVWLGDSNADPAKVAAVAESLRGKKCLVVYFGSTPPASLPDGALRLDNFAPRASVQHLALLGNILSMWTETAELAAATARQGRTLFFLQSHSVDGARQREALYGNATFHDGIPAMAPVMPGVLAEAYLSALRRQISALRDRDQTTLTALGRDIARRSHSGPRTIVTSYSHMLPFAVPSDTASYHFANLDDSRGRLAAQLAPGSLLVFIGYVAVPLDLWHAVRSARATAAWIVAPLPGEVDFRQFGDISIAQPWQIGDACVTVPGYDIRILPPSGVIQLVIFDALMAAAE